MGKYFSLILVWLLLSCYMPAVQAAVINLPAGGSIQNTLFTALDGDIIQLEAGEYVGDINFFNKKVTIRGVGEESVIRGVGTAPVVFFINNENEESVIDQVTITGGLNQGAIRIIESSPIIRRCTITDNTATAGNASAISIAGKDEDGNSPQLINNIISRNKAQVFKAKGVDAITIIDSSPSLINNTIVQNHNRTINVSGDSQPIIKNNLVAFNGTLRDGAKRGKGLLLNGNIARNNSVVNYNLFFDNGSKEIVTLGAKRETWDYLYGAELALSNKDLANNVDANPKIKNVKTLNLNLNNNSPLFNKGDPAAEFVDEADASRNDIGASGGPTPHPNYVE